MTGGLAVVDLPRGALLRLLDRIDHLLGEDARTFHLPPGAQVNALEQEIVAALERLPDATGFAVFWGPAARMVVAPPFPIEVRSEATGYQTAPLRQLLERPRTLGVILVRLGGYSV